jgi:hypothetical protein
MNIFVLSLSFIILYIIKGIVWVIIDVYWFKTTYGSFTTTLANHHVVAPISLMAII